jgi:two-component system sensor histidine kinase QseC
VLKPISKAISSDKTSNKISIRGFLFRVLLATIILTLFVSVLQGYEAGSKEIQQQMDAKLVDLATLLSNQVVSKNHEHDAAYTLQTGEKFAFQIFSAEKDLLRYSTQSKELIAPLQTGFSETNFNGYRWRTYGFFNLQNKRWVIVAERIDVRFALVEKIILKSLAPIVIGIPIAALLIWWVIGHGLRPLYRLSNVLLNKPDNDLSALHIKQPYTEVEQVIQSMNNLLNRLTLSFEREKRFASDVAHELRTPLSVLKIDLFNISQKNQHDVNDIAILNQSVSRMEHLVQQILTLYRTTPDQFMARFATQDLYAIAQKIIAAHYQAIDEKAQTIALYGESCTLEGDQAALEILLANLISNAYKYTPEGGEIRVTITSEDHAIMLDIDDSGVGIDETLYSRVFERFYRVDGDRHTSNELGCGIGLSIVKHIVDLHKATISLHHSCFVTGLKVKITFPKG